MNFIDYAKTVAQKLVAHKSSIEQNIVNGMSSSLEHYKDQTGIIKGINFSLNALQQIHDDWMSTGMTPVEIPDPASEVSSSTAAQEQSDGSSVSEKVLETVGETIINTVL